MAEEMLTLPKFEEASEIVKKVTQETKLVYSKYFSEQTGNKVYLKPENIQLTMLPSDACAVLLLPPADAGFISHLICDLRHILNFLSVQ